jgi:hypothetical protein
MPGLRRATGCRAVNLFSPNGTDGGQDVFHFHLHLIPVPEGEPFPLQLPDPARRCRHAIAARRDGGPHRPLHPRGTRAVERGDAGSDEFRASCRSGRARDILRPAPRIPYPRRREPTPPDERFAPTTRRSTSLVARCGSTPSATIERTRRRHPRARRGRAARAVRGARAQPAARRGAEAVGEERRHLQGVARHGRGGGDHRPRARAAARSGAHDVVAPMIRNAGACHEMGMPLARCSRLPRHADSPSGGRDGTSATCARRALPDLTRRRHGAGDRPGSRSASGSAARTAWR